MSCARGIRRCWSATADSGSCRALDTRSPEVCGSLVLHAIENGVLAIWANNRPETLLVMPPLVIRPAEVDEVIDGIGRALAAVH